MDPGPAGRRRRPGTSPTLPRVEWREGVHLVGTPLWCDARCSRDVCFVSSARVGELRRHRQILTSDRTALLLEASGALPRAGARSRQTEATTASTRFPNSIRGGFVSDFLTRPSRGGSLMIRDLNSSGRVPASRRTMIAP